MVLDGRAKESPVRLLTLVALSSIRGLTVKHAGILEGWIVRSEAGSWIALAAPKTQSLSRRNSAGARSAKLMQLSKDHTGAPVSAYGTR